MKAKKDTLHMLYDVAMVVILALCILLCFFLYSKWIAEQYKYANKVICVEARIVSIDVTNEKVCVFNEYEFDKGVEFAKYDSSVYGMHLSIGEDILVLWDDATGEWVVVGFKGE